MTNKLSMIYNKIDTELISVGTPKKFNETEDKWITPVYYNGSDLELTLKNKYVKIEKVEENIYGKDFITIKSKEYSDLIESITKKLDVYNPIQSDGSFRATINSKTKISEPLEKIKDKTFNCCISLSMPTTYSDENKKTLQIHLKDLIIIKILNEDLEIDYNNLEEAM